MEYWLQHTMSLYTAHVIVFVLSDSNVKSNSHCLDIGASIVNKISKSSTARLTLSWESIQIFHLKSKFHFSSKKIQFFTKSRLLTKKSIFLQILAPGAGPVTSNNIFGFRTDILLQLLNIKARRAYPGTTNISDIVPMLLKHLYETMEKNDTSVSVLKNRICH